MDCVWSFCSHVSASGREFIPPAQASPVPGEGNEQQALYWQVSDDFGLTWSAPRAPLQPINSSSGRPLPMWSPVLHTRVRCVPLSPDYAVFGLLRTAAVGQILNGSPA
jgi:hypothetical protein